jgi:NAD-dependent dihydropyrimidine dehydrogenase PreA subunit
VPVLVNYKICDKGKSCPCISVCPTKAWYWDEKNKRPAVDNTKCTNCWTCIKACPARAVLFAFTEKELEGLKKEVEKDPRTEKDLMIERYNSDPVNPEIMLSAENFDKVIDSNELVFVEFWGPKFLTRCRINAPAYRDILPKNKNIVIRKLNADENPDIAKKYGIFSLPSLVLFHKGKPIEKFGKVFGCSSVAEAGLLKEKIDRALNSL